MKAAAAPPQPRLTPLLVDGEPVKYDLCPARFRAPLENWIEHGIDPGYGLRAVLCNDFFTAVISVPDDATQDLPALARWLYNHAPRGSFGSEATYLCWRASRRG